MDKFKYVVCVVWYYPTQVQIENTYALINDFEHVYIYDNTPDGRNSNHLRNESITYIFKGKNVGLAQAYNEIINILPSGKVFMCIMDQDSKLEQESVYILKKYIEMHEMTAIGIVAPHISIRGKVKDNVKKTETAAWTINAGSFLNVSLLRERDIYYDTHYFLDRLDRDYCMQITRAGLKIVKVADCVLEQELGDENSRGFVEHSASRHYYISRERLYYNHKYFPFIKEYLYDLLQILRHICSICLYESNKRVKVQCVVKGIRDYYASRK